MDDTDTEAVEIFRWNGKGELTLYAKGERMWLTEYPANRSQENLARSRRLAEFCERHQITLGKFPGDKVRLVA